MSLGFPCLLFRSSLSSAEVKIRSLKVGQNPVCLCTWSQPVAVWEAWSHCTRWDTVTAGILRSLAMFLFSHLTPVRERKEASDGNPWWENELISPENLYFHYILRESPDAAFSGKKVFLGPWEKSLGYFTERVRSDFCLWLSSWAWRIYCP